MSSGGEGAAGGGGAVEQVREPYDYFQAFTLRDECFKRGIRPIKRTHCNKKGYIRVLRQFDRARAVLQPPSALQTASVRPSSANPSGARGMIAAATAPQPTCHCFVRLVNVVSSNKFDSRMLDVPSNSGDALLVARTTRFWESVQQAFVSNDSVFDAYMDNHACLAGIDPSFALPHQPAALQAMWSDLRAAYLVARAAMERSPGGSRADFFDFCSGRAEVYYLHCWWELEPERFDLTRADPRVSLAIESTSPSLELNKSQRERSAAAPREEDGTLQLIGRVIRSFAEHVDQQADTRLQRQLDGIVSTLGDLRKQLKEYGPNSTEFAEIKSDIVWVTSELSVSTVFIWCGRIVYRVLTRKHPDEMVIILGNVEYNYAQWKAEQQAALFAAGHTKVRERHSSSMLPVLGKNGGLWSIRKLQSHS